MPAAQQQAPHRDDDDKTFRDRVIAASEGYPALHGINARTMWLHHVQMKLGISFEQMKSKRHVFEDGSIEREIQWGKWNDLRPILRTFLEGANQST